MSGHVRVSDTATSYVAYTMPSAGMVTVQFDFRTDYTDHGTLMSVSGQSNSFIGLWESGSSSTIIRTDAVTFNGVAPSATTRDALTAEVATKDWIRCRIENVGTRDDDPAYPLAIDDVIHFGHFYLASQYRCYIEMRNFKIDIGNTGSWTAESRLGDSNGFTQHDLDVWGAGDPATEAATPQILSPYMTGLMQ